ncbi:MAG: hypothetical protein KJO80_00845 [Gammaproteobacteria bacterium]|nr:hypothetical protein [Gammaproteobacteria bacterium]
MLKHFSYSLNRHCLWSRFDIGSQLLILFYALCSEVLVYNFLGVESLKQVQFTRYKKAQRCGAFLYLAQREGLQGTSLYPALRVRFAHAKTLPAFLSNLRAAQGLFI